MIICCGEALIDMVKVPARDGGEGFLPLPGGSPCNTAAAIGKLGVPVKFLGRISTDFFGELLMKRFRDYRVQDDLIIRSGQNSSLAFVKLAKGKDPQYVFYTDGTADSSLSAENLPDKLPADTRCIVFGSIAMTMEPIASAIEALIMREGTRKSADQMDGAPVISFDPNIRPFMIKDRGAYIERFEKWVAASTIVKISSEDFTFLYPKLDTDKALQKVLAMGPRLAICTLGPKGALALLRRNDGSVTRVTAPVVDLPVVDTIGAGDTFHGAFLSRLEIKGKMSRSALVNLSEAELYGALLFANKAASIVCSRSGATPPARREVERLKIQAAILPPENPQAKPAGKSQAEKSQAKNAAVEAAQPAASLPVKSQTPKIDGVMKAPVKPAEAKPAVKVPEAKTAAPKPVTPEVKPPEAIKAEAPAKKSDGKK